MRSLAVNIKTKKALISDFILERKLRKNLIKPNMKTTPSCSWDGCLVLGKHIMHYVLMICFMSKIFYLWSTSSKCVALSKCSVAQMYSTQLWHSIGSVVKSNTQFAKYFITTTKFNLYESTALFLVTCTSIPSKCHFIMHYCDSVIIIIML